MKIKTNDSNYTVVIEDGERVYPCRCGETHKGEYALYEFAHHECLHETDLMGLPAGKNKIQAICPNCGMSWLVKLQREDL